MSIFKIKFPGIVLIISLFFLSTNMYSQNLREDSQLDNRVREFLRSQRWYDMNIPSVDGQLLYDIIIKTITQVLLRLALPPVIRVFGLPGH